MPITDPESIVTEKDLAAFYQGIRPYLTKGGKRPEPSTIYGMRITNSESSPDNKVTYLEDCAGFTPAHMDFSNGTFDYGSWSDAFFMPKPCMLKYDGTVDYYLDPNDYTKKEDGTASDVANTSYGGNAMMEWGQNGKKIWLKIVPDPEDSNKSADIYIADKQIDVNYTDWPFHNSDGVSVDHFYTPIYNSSLISSKFRSISGQSSASAYSPANERTYAQANNPSEEHLWDTEVFADNQLINFLCILISKSTNSKAKFGSGIGGNTKSYTTGACNTRGLFYGTTGSAAIKIFGMENWWGLKARRCVGLVIVNGSRKVKMTYGTEDGSTTTGYNLNGSGYITPGITAPSGSTGGYIKEMLFNEYGMFPVTMSGASSSTYYCNGIFYKNSVTSVCQRGGGSDYGGIIGMLCESLAGDNRYWNVSANISCKPKAPE